MAKTGQNLAFLMLKGAPAWKKYTTAGRGGRDKYELWVNNKYASDCVSRAALVIHCVAATADNITGSFTWKLLTVGWSWWADKLWVAYSLRWFKVSSFSFWGFVFGELIPESAADDTRLQQVALEGCGATMVAAKKSWLAYSLRWFSVSERLFPILLLLTHHKGWLLTDVMFQDYQPNRWTE